MRTSVEISDVLLGQAKRLACKCCSLLLSLVKEALPKVISTETERRDKPFKLQNITYGKGGMKSKFQNAGWVKLRNEIYGER